MTTPKSFHVLIAEDDNRLKRHETLSEARQEAVRLAGITSKTIFHCVAVEAIAKIKPLPRFFVAESEVCKTEFTKRGILFLRADSDNGPLLRVYTSGNSGFSACNFLETAEVHVTEGDYREITKEEAEKLLEGAKYPKYFNTHDAPPVLVARFADDPGQWRYKDGTLSDHEHDSYTAERWASQQGYTQITKEEADKLTTPEYPKYFKVQPGGPEAVFVVRSSDQKAGTWLGSRGQVFESGCSDFLATERATRGGWTQINVQEADSLTSGAASELSVPIPEYPKYFKTDTLSHAVAYVANSPTHFGTWFNKDGSLEESNVPPVAVDYAGYQRWPEITKEQAYALLPVPQPSKPAVKFPRFFTHAVGFHIYVAYHKYTSPCVGEVVDKQGNVVKMEDGAGAYKNALEFTAEGDWKEITETEALALIELPYPRYYTYEGGSCAFFEVASPTSLTRSVYRTGEFDPMVWNESIFGPAALEESVKTGFRKRLTKAEALSRLDPNVRAPREVSSVLLA